MDMDDKDDFRGAYLIVQTIVTISGNIIMEEMNYIETHWGKDTIQNSSLTLFSFLQILAYLTHWPLSSVWY